MLAAAEGLANERLVRWFVGMRAMMDIDVVIVRRGVSGHRGAGRGASRRAGWWR